MAHWALCLDSHKKYWVLASCQKQSIVVPPTPKEDIIMVALSWPKKAE